MEWAISQRDSALRETRYRYLITLPYCVHVPGIDITSPLRAMREVGSLIHRCCVELLSARS
ncbi:MAG: hypothetical protein ABF780_02580 [Bifidobacterium aquikefiri]|uniref:hypothetical protein n=1 Tax=Bifidobacterium aquikefiri TaxID=1653207 RepID=UPI001302ED64|nr:hypothetical protein [Bifidobacterium aquikefiri]